MHGGSISNEMIMRLAGIFALQAVVNYMYDIIAIDKEDGYFTVTFVNDGFCISNTRQYFRQLRLN